MAIEVLLIRVAGTKMLCSSVAKRSQFAVLAASSVRTSCIAKKSPSMSKSPRTYASPSAISLIEPSSTLSSLNVTVNCGAPSPNRSTSPEASRISHEIPLRALARSTTSPSFRAASERGLAGSRAPGAGVAGTGCGVAVAGSVVCMGGGCAPSGGGACRAEKRGSDSGDPGTPYACEH